MHEVILGALPEGAQDVVHRDAVRALIVDGDGILLLRTPSTGDLKLPGGGLAPGEDAAAALRREVAEECGLVVGSVGPRVLTVIERRADAADPRASFEMTSAYHRVTLAAGTVPRALDDYEEALGLEPVRLTVPDAIAVLDGVLRRGQAAPWTAREAAVLRLLATGALDP